MTGNRIERALSFLKPIGIAGQILIRCFTKSKDVGGKFPHNMVLAEGIRFLFDLFKGITVSRFEFSFSCRRHRELPDGRACGRLFAFAGR